MDFITKQAKRLEKRTSRGDGASRTNHEKNMAKRLEQQAINELPGKINEAIEAYNVVSKISSRSQYYGEEYGLYQSFNDDDATRSIKSAEPIRDFYKTNWLYLKMDKNSFQKLTGAFTEFQEKWKKAKPSGISGLFGGETESPEMLQLKSWGINATETFLINAINDMRGRLDPGLDSREQMSKEVKNEREVAMAQRWMNLFEKKNMVDAKVPDYKGPEWGNFVSNRYDTTIDDMARIRMLYPNSRDVDLVADIMAGGNNYEIEDKGERDTPKYESYMEYIYGGFQAFLQDQQKLTY